jgi:hypothetical protein
MSDLHEEPDDDEILHADAVEDQADFQGLVEEKDGDYQAAVDAHQRGEEPEEDRPNPSMP